MPRSLFVLAILLTLTWSSSSPDAAMDDLLIAIVDEHAVAGPVMRYDGRAWHSRWPAPDEKLTRTPPPATLDAIPRAWVGRSLPATWIAWPLDRTSARTPIPIRLTKPVRVDAHCLPAVGLQSDYPTRATTDAHAFPKRKVAIAVTDPTVQIHPIAVLPVDSDEGRALTRTLRAPFLALARRDSAKAADPLDVAADVPIRWTRIWTARDPHSGDRLALVDGHMDVPRAPRFYAGSFWIRDRGTPGRPLDRRGRVFLTDEDFKGNESSAPLGILAIGARSFWLEQVNGYESEAYRLIELSAPHWPEALRVQGGGC